MSDRVEQLLGQIRIVPKYDGEVPHCYAQGTPGENYGGDDGMSTDAKGTGPFILHDFDI